MRKNLRNKISIFFVIIFMALIAAPIVITTIDDTVDISCFFGINEEEENEAFKHLVEIDLFDSDFVLSDVESNVLIVYTFKTYPKPHLNLISPPPDFI